MFRIHTVALTVPVVVFGLGLTPAGADAQFTAEDIVRHFQQQQAATAAKPIAPSETETGATTVNAGTGDSGLVLPLTGARRKKDKLQPLPQLPAKSGYDLLITFETGSDRLTPQAQQNLSAFASALKTPQLAAFAFEVQGHTDAVGPADVNQALSERRAESVVAFLVGLGIENDRLKARGFGETQPLKADPNHPDNRRVETRRLR